MATIQDILTQKGRQVATIGKEETVLKAARRMNELHIGALVITDAEGKVEGIFTERDILTRVVAQEVNPAEATVGEYMTEDLVTVPLEISIDEVQQIMTANRVRHLPIIDKERKLAGMLSIGDMLKHELQTKEATISDLKKYVFQ